MSGFLYSVAGVLVGGLITLFVSDYYSRQASAELRRETIQLRRAANMIILTLVEAGHIEAEDVRGDPETNLVDFVRIKGETMRRMTMHPDEKATMYGLLSDPLPEPPRPWWRRMFGG